MNTAERQDTSRDQGQQVPRRTPVEALQEHPRPEPAVRVRVSPQHVRAAMQARRGRAQTPGRRAA